MGWGGVRGEGWGGVRGWGWGLGGWCLVRAGVGGDGAGAEFG